LTELGLPDLILSQSHRFYAGRGKRIFDASASALALLVLSPIFLIVALLIKLTSNGPAIYFQDRVGRGGRLFRIAKFRSMQDNAEGAGPAITWFGDARITAVGSALRLLKIDELPQLWNVLKGDMSLVGPRPEIPRYVRLYTGRQRKVLAVRPGVTDLASIQYRNEERILSQSSDPERLYEHVILPHKLDMNLEYLEKISFSYDLLLLAMTAMVITPSQLNRRVPNAGI